MIILSNINLVDSKNKFEQDIRRTIDCLAAMTCIVIFSPLFLICYLAIKKEDHGPAIFKQERIGRYGQAFYIYKFRSMKVNAEQNGPQLAKNKVDGRLTKTGRFLRLHHLDELPQLWNVAKGDMAFVGPRPERKYYIDKIMEKDYRYSYLYQIRPGVTSYATLTNGYTGNIEKMLKRLELDLFYLEHRSWLLDLKILGMTFLKIVFGRKF